RLGGRRGFAAWTVIFTAASLACALAGSITALDAARAVQGLGAAMLFATSLALIADAFPDKDGRAGAFAVYGATIGPSFRLGPLVGGCLISALGWRSVFYLTLPLGAAALIATAAWVRESRDPLARPIDWAGQAALTTGLFLLVLALLRGNGDGWTSAAIMAELASAAALLALFVLIERNSRAPMLPLTLFRVRAFSGAQLAAFAISASFFAIFVYSTLYLQGILHLSPIQAGLVYLPATGSLFLASAATAQLLTPATPGFLVAAGHVVASPAPDPATHRDRSRPVQPARERRRPQLGATPAERARGRRERHLPPSGDRGRGRGFRRAYSGGRRARTRLRRGLRARAAPRDHRRQRARRRWRPALRA